MRDIEGIKRRAGSKRMMITAIGNTALASQYNQASTAWLFEHKYPTKRAQAMSDTAGRQPMVRFR